ncbi:MAG: hypothetical protein K5780_00445 [Alphaproteobacteria bacterium]|nr:hypothetical protein [Alphaproteobacteria bacterium]
MIKHSVLCFFSLLLCGNCFGMGKKIPERRAYPEVLSVVDVKESSLDSEEGKAVKETSENISNEDWLKKNNGLIDAACFDEDSFEELLDVLEEESRVDLYDQILRQWDNANVFDATHNDKVFIASFKKDTYDW